MIRNFDFTDIAHKQKTMFHPTKGFVSDVPVFHPTKGKIIINKDDLDMCMIRMFMTWKNMMKKNGEKNHTLYISNEAYMEMVFMDKLKKHTIRDEKGMKRKYVMKDEGVYVNKNNTSIVAPYWFNAMILTLMDSSHLPIGRSFEDKDKVMERYYNDLQNNLTGNHYRNNFIKVPPKSIGQ